MLRGAPIEEGTPPSTGSPRSAVERGPASRQRRPTRRQQRDRAAARAAIPDLVDVVTIGIRAGLSPSAALTEAQRHLDAPLCDHVGLLIGEVDRGARLADALSAFGRELGGDAATFADTLGTACRYGQPIEPVLDRLATDSRMTRRRNADIYARTLPVRLAFPLVICTLPGFVLCAIVPALLGALSSLGDLSP